MPTPEQQQELNNSLQSACTLGVQDVDRVRYLLAQGADPLAKEDNGLNALEITLQNAVEWQLNKDVFQAQVNKGQKLPDPRAFRVMNEHRQNFIDKAEAIITNSQQAILELTSYEDLDKNWLEQAKDTIKAKTNDGAAYSDLGEQFDSCFDKAWDKALEDTGLSSKPSASPSQTGGFATGSLGSGSVGNSSQPEETTSRRLGN